MVAAVNEAYTSLTPEEQAKACILTKNYGEAGAMAYYGKELGLPRAISGHNSYYLWGPQGCTGEVLISVGRPLRDLSDAFESVTAGPAWSCKYCMPYENGTWIYIGRGLKLQHGGGLADNEGLELEQRRKSASQTPWANPSPHRSLHREDQTGRMHDSDAVSRSGLQPIRRADRDHDGRGMDANARALTHADADPVWPDRARRGSRRRARLQPASL